MGYLFLALIGLTASYAFDLFSFDNGPNANDNEAPADDQTPPTFNGTSADDTVVLDLDGDDYSTENQPQKDDTHFYVTEFHDEYNLGQGNDELVQELGDSGNENFVVNGEEGNDTITSFSYATELNGNEGDDFIRGMATNTIHGGEGNDILQMELDQVLNDTSGGGTWGDEGNDTLRVYADIFDLPDYSSGFLKGGEGQDTFEVYLNLQDLALYDGETSETSIKMPSGISIPDFDPSAGDTLEINLLDFRSVKEDIFTADLTTETRYDFGTEQYYTSYVLNLEFAATEDYPVTTTKIYIGSTELGPLTLDDISFTYLERT